MELIYNGVDITESVEIVRCVQTDAACGKSDCLELTLGSAGTWFSWKPERGDRIEARQDGYTSGTMYLHTVDPMDDEFRIFATGMKRAAWEKRTASYENITLGGLMGLLAAECGMTYKLFGLDAGIKYPYLLRENESAAAFLSRLLEWEGAVLKGIGGCFTGISVKEAQKLSPLQRIEIQASTPGTRYTRRDDFRIKRLTVATPFATASAMDGAADGMEKRRTDMPARDSATAGRWARGALLMHNRQYEEQIITSEFNAGFTAMARIDIEGGTDANGEWIISEVEHDFMGMNSRAKLLRCVNSIA